MSEIWFCFRLVVATAKKGYKPDVKRHPWDIGESVISV